MLLRVPRTPSAFIAALRDGDIVEPLPIQALSIPDVLAGKDIAAKAPTGSGKTLAFSLPMAARLSRGRGPKPSGLILAPTRELAAQIATELAPFAKLRGLRTCCIYGGVGYQPQISALRRGVDIVIACPGRLEDLIASSHVRLDEVSFVVIDEADRMADMGFLPAVRRILDAVKPDRQTLLFSATLDGDVDVLMRSYQRQPVRHEVETDAGAETQVEYQFMDVQREDRVATCARLIAEHGSSIVFVRTKHGADRLVRQLGNLGTNAAALHGDRSQGQRERALASFRDLKGPRARRDRRGRPWDPRRRRRVRDPLRPHRGTEGLHPPLGPDGSSGAERTRRRARHPRVEGDRIDPAPCAVARGRAARRGGAQASCAVVTPTAPRWSGSWSRVDRTGSDATSSVVIHDPGGAGPPRPSREGLLVLQPGTVATDCVKCSDSSLAQFGLSLCPSCQCVAVSIPSH